MSDGLHVEQTCKKCGLPHGSGDVRARPRRDGGCSFCGGERAPSSRLCRQCHATYMRGHRRSYREMSPSARAKDKARSTASAALRRGAIKRGPCVDCRSRRAEMHHADYSKPLKITWLCRMCHMARHADGEESVPPAPAPDARTPLGRTWRVPVVSFRLTGAERQRLEADAVAAGVTVNELARRRALAIETVDTNSAHRQTVDTNTVNR